MTSFQEDQYCDAITKDLPSFDFNLEASLSNFELNFTF